MKPWYDRAFGPFYSALYPHRNESEARQALDLLGDWLPVEDPLLDVGCGGGRYLRALAERGRSAVGVDRSQALLTRAQEAQPDARLLRVDMRRLPFPDRCFPGLLNMFTSFGYFEDRDAHRRLLGEFARVVRPGGRLVLDYLNASAVRRTLIPVSRRVVEDFTVHEHRRIERRGDEERVIKEITILDSRGTERDRYREEVALYERREVLALLVESGWDELETWGDYAGGPHHEGSQRLIIVAEQRGSV